MSLGMGERLEHAYAWGYTDGVCGNDRGVIQYKDKRLQSAYSDGYDAGLLAYMRIRRKAKRMYAVEEGE